MRMETKASVRETNAENDCLTESLQNLLNPAKRGGFSVSMQKQIPFTREMHPKWLFSDTFPKLTGPRQNLHQKELTSVAISQNGVSISIRHSGRQLVSQSLDQWCLLRQLFLWTFFVLWIEKSEDPDGRSHVVQCFLLLCVYATPSLDFNVTDCRNSCTTVHVCWSVFKGITALVWSQWMGKGGWIETTSGRDRPRPTGPPSIDVTILFPRSVRSRSQRELNCHCREARNVEKRGMRTRG